VLALPHAHLLPEVVAPGSDLGAIRPEFAARFGISPHCRIHAGTTDGNAAFIASGVTEPGIGVTMLGTTLVLNNSPPSASRLRNTACIATATAICGWWAARRTPGRGY